MNRKILNLESLIHEHKSRARNKLKIFEDILDTCHAQIKRFNSEFKLNECYFSIPLIVTGIQANEINHLINFLIYSLCENGLFCEYKEDTNQIYISWKEEDIDIVKYFNLKKSIDHEINHAYQSKFSDMKTGKVSLNEDLLINKKKEKNAKYIQYERERQFQRNIQSVKVNPMTYEDFIRKF